MLSWWSWGSSTSVTDWHLSVAESQCNGQANLSASAQSVSSVAECQWSHSTVSISSVTHRWQAGKARITSFTVHSRLTDRQKRLQSDQWFSRKQLVCVTTDCATSQCVSPGDIWLYMMTWPLVENKFTVLSSHLPNYCRTSVQSLIKKIWMAL